MGLNNKIRIHYIKLGSLRILGNVKKKSIVLRGTDIIGYSYDRYYKK
jgi:hypothetical protein